jgi:hypothetical protein
MSDEIEKNNKEIEEIEEIDKKYEDDKKYENKEIEEIDKKYENKRLDDREDDKKYENKRLDDREDDKKYENKRLDDKYENHNRGTSVYDIILNNHSIKGEKGSQYVVFKLNNNQSIIGPISNIYTKNNIHKESNAVLKNMKYTGLHTETSGYVAFGCNYQNSILYFKVEKDSVFYISKYNIVAYTDNILFENDMIIKCVSGEYGYVWIASYGSYEKVELKDSESIELNSGMLVMSTSFPIEQNMSYTLTGPSYFIFQSKNIKNIYKQVSQNVPVAIQPTASKKGFFSTFFSGGGTSPNIEEKRIRTITRYI